MTGECLASGELRALNMYGIRIHLGDTKLKVCLWLVVAHFLTTMFTLYFVRSIVDIFEDPSNPSNVVWVSDD